MLKEALIEQITEQPGRPNLAEIRMLHTRVVNKEILGMLAAGSLHTVELDISSTEDGEHYIGHHSLFYKDRDLNFPPPNVPIEEAMLVINTYGIFTKLDCKDEKAIPKTAELAQRLKPNSCMLHAFVKEFDFQESQRESHWVYENIDLEKIIELRDNTKYPALQVSCRGFTYNGIATLEGDQISNLHEVCARAREDKIEIVNLNLPGNQVPPDWALQYFYENGVLLEVYENKVGERQLPCDVFTTIEV